MEPLGSHLAVILHNEELRAAIIDEALAAAEQPRLD